MKLKIAIFQLDIAFGDPKANIKKVTKYLERLDSTTDLVLLPELWLTGYDLDHLEKTADPDAAKISFLISQWAQKYQVHIVAGSIAKKTDAGVFNTLLAFHRNGQKLAEYDKVHLFRLMNEEKYMLPGEQLGRFDLEQIPCAAVICYDIRFPEWIRRHVLDGAQVLFVPAEWPITRLNHWKTLLTARAIENQCYVVACNRVGSDPNNTFAGHSMIIDPWGEAIAEAGQEETVLYGEIDISKVHEVRSRIPIFSDRRPELY